MAFMSDPLSLLFFAGAVVLAFFIGRLGRKVIFWWKARKAPKPSGPPPSRQVQRAQRRRQDKRMRD